MSDCNFDPAGGSGTHVRFESAHPASLAEDAVQEGAVEQDSETRRYLIGQEISLLGLARTRRFPLLTLADPYMSELADQVGDTVYLSIRHEHDSICVGRRTGRHPIQVLSIEVGVIRPLGAGVSGVALSASLGREESVELVRGNAARLEVMGERVEDVIARVEVARRGDCACGDGGEVGGGEDEGGGGGIAGRWGGRWKLGQIKAAHISALNTAQGKQNQ